MVGRFLDKDYQKQLEKSIKSLNNVHLIGEVKHENLSKYYNMADVFVCTSRDEALGLVIPEAMSYGKAIISSNVGGIPEIIEDKINGILIQNEDHNALISNIIHIYQDKVFKSALEENAYRKFKDTFTLEKYGDNFLKIMQDF
jgi:glycosyltransferase involved in cell wall biosynthesis